MSNSVNAHQVQAVSQTPGSRMGQKPLVQRAAEVLKNMPESKRSIEEYRILQQLLEKDKAGGTNVSQYVIPNNWAEHYKRYLQGQATIPSTISYEVTKQQLRMNALQDSEINTAGENVVSLFECLYVGAEKLLTRSELYNQIKQEIDLQSSTSSYRFATPQVRAKPSINQIDAHSKSVWSAQHSTSTLPDSSKRTVDSDKYPEFLNSSTSLQGHLGDDAAEDMANEDDSVTINKKKLLRPGLTGNSISDSTRDTLDSTKSSQFNQKQELLSYIHQHRCCSKSHRNLIYFEDKHLKEIRARIVDIYAVSSVSKVVPDPLAKYYGGLNKTVVGKVNALSNPGQYCYANSVIQLLFTIPELADYFLNHLEGFELADYPILEYFKNTVQEYFANHLVLLNANNLINNFKSRLDFQEREQQQDVDEFLRKILDDLHIALKKLLAQDQMLAELALKVEQSKDRWIHHRVKEPSVITFLFTGEIKTTIVCMSCLASSKNFEPFECLPLDLDDEPVTLERLFQKSVEPELIEKDFNCEKCKQRTPATILKEFSRLPPYMLVQLKRFRQGSTIIKDERNVKLRPDRLLNLESCSTDPGVKVFELQGIIHHLGTMFNGHYKTTAFRPSTEHPDRWVLFDDGQLYVTEPQRFLEKQAYILLFKRQG